MGPQPEGGVYCLGGRGWLLFMGVGYIQKLICQNPKQTQKLIFSIYEIWIQIRTIGPNGPMGPMVQIWAQIA